MRAIMSRVVLSLFAASALSVSIATPASAREGNSIGGGVKCYYVLVSSTGTSQTYKTVCRKGV
jgi:hypothetical protein